MKRLLLFLMMVSFLSQAQRPQSVSEMRIESGAHWLDLRYASDNETGHRMDVHLPAEGEGPFPVVLSIYGSAWLSNSWKAHSFSTGIGQYLLKHGYAVASVNYRSSGDAQFPAQIHDVKAAIRFLRANADALQLDAERIGVTGWSSGGHLAAMAGTTSGLDSLKVAGSVVDLEGSLGEYPDADSSVLAVVDWFGPTDFLIMDQCGSTMEHDAADSPESLLVGGPIQDHPDEVKQADPASYASPGSPPFLIFHGDKDPLVPHCQSEHLRDKLMEQNASVELTIVEGGGHGPGVMIDTYYARMIEFLDGILK